MARYHEKGQPIGRIIEDIFLSDVLLLCPICGRELRPVDEQKVLFEAQTLGMKSPSELVLSNVQHMGCWICCLIWQYQTELVADNRGDEELEQKLRAFDLDTLTVVRKWTRTSVLTYPNPEPLVKSVRRKPPLVKNLDWLNSLVMVHFNDHGLPDEFRNCHTRAGCLSAYAARCYLSYQSLREGNSEFTKHMSDCDYCLGLMRAAQHHPKSLCPPVDILFKTKAKLLPAPLQGLIWHHVWNTEIRLADCTCQKIWPGLRPSV